jgi:signal transduction histidine kinase
MGGELKDRQRFERTLHDGVQQDLVALAVRLQLARDLLASDSEGAATLLEELRQHIHSMIGSLRLVADEIYPAILDARGLGDALRDVPNVRVHGVGRHPQAVEAAVYFYCLEVEGEIDIHEDARGLRVDVRGGSPSRFRELAEAAGASFYDSAR